MNATELLLDLRRRVETLETIEQPNHGITARVYSTSTQSCTTATWCRMTFNSQRWDTDGMHSTSANSGRLTCRTAGNYVISGNVQWQSNAGGNRRIRLYLNNSTVIAHSSQDPIAAAVVTTQTISTQYVLSTGDYVELYGFQNSGIALNVEAAANYSPEFSMTLIP